MAKQLSKSDVNHLRRLLGWVRCEVGQSPEELVATVRHIASKIDIGEYGKQRMVEAHQQASRVPKYIRAALKALEKHVREAEGEVVDAETAGLPQKRRSRTKLQVSQRRLPSP